MPSLYFRIESDYEKVIRLREEISRLESQMKSMDANKSPAAVATLNRQINEAQSQLKGMVSEAAKTAVMMDGDFKSKIYKGSQAVNDFTQKIISQKAVVKNVEADVRRLTDAYRSVRMNPLKGNNALGELNAAKRVLNEERSALFDLTQQQANARLSVKKLKDEYALYNTEIKDSTSSTFSLGKTLGIIGGIATLRQLGSKILDVRSQFRSAEVSLETMVGEEQAKKLLSKNKQYAKISPLEFMDIQSSTEMMIGFNIEAEKVPRYIEAIGDISRGNSQKFQSLSLAFSQMSAAGKLMGQDLNQMINAGFNPLQFIAEKTGKTIAQLKDEMSKGAISAEMVQQAFIDATSAGGKFYGMSQKQSEEVAGQMSILSDTISNKLNEIGESNEGLIKTGIKGATALVDNYEEIGKAITILITTYGTYKTALVLSSLLEEGGSKALWGKIAATKAATVAQATYNKVLLMNPYVAVTAGVVALGIALYTLSDSTSAQEKEYKKLIDRQEEYDKYLENEKKRIDDLLSVLQDELATREAKLEAFKELQKLSPSIFGTYKTEKQLVDNLTEARKKENEQLLIRQKMMTSYNQINDINNLKNLKRLQELERVGEAGRTRQGSQAEYQSLYQQFNIKRDKGFLETDADVIKGKINAISSIIGAEQDNMRKSQQIAFTLSLDNMTKESAKAYLKMYEGYRIILRNSGKEWLQIQGEEAPLTDKILVNRIQSLNDKIINIEEKSAKDYINEAKSAWDKAKKNVEDIKASAKTYTSADQYEKELKKADDAEKAAKERYEKLGGSTTKKETESEKLRKETEKYNVLLTKQALDEKRRAEDLQMSVDEARIKAMDDGSKKTIAQMELNFEKEMQAIDRQKEDILRKKIEDARSAFEANPKKKKGKKFDASGITLSDKENKYFDELYKTGITNYDKIYDEYINRYQSYTDQRITIEKKFNDDIAILKEARKKAQEKGDKDELAKIDSAIAKATTEKGKAIMQNSYEMLKQSPDYIRAFEDLKNTSSETLMSLVDQFEAVKDSAAASLNPEGLREYTNTIRELMDELDSRNPFKAFSDRKKELIDAERELIIAQKQLDAVTNGAKIVTGVKSLKLDNGKIKAENVYLSASEALAKYNKAKEKANEVNNNFQKAEKASLEKVDGLANALSNLGGTIGGTSGEIISLIGNVGSFTTEAISGITNISQKGASALIALEKASVILTILQASIQLMQSLNSILPDAYDEYEKYAAKIEEINKLTDAVNDYKIALLEASNAESGWFSEDNLKNLRDYKEIQEAVWDAYISKLEEAQAIYQNQSGGGWLTNTTFIGLYNSLFGHDYEKGTTAAINNLRIETRKRSKGFLGSGIGGKSQKTEDLQTWINENKDKFKGLDTNLFDKELNLNTELAKSILDNYGDKLVGQTKETLEALMELQEKYDEYLEQLHEYVSSLYEPLVDDFVDSLWDWFDDGKDALDSFKNYASDTFRDIVSDMLKTIVLDKVVGSFSDDIANVYEEYAKGKIDETGLMKKVAELTNTLIGNYKENIPTLENILNEVNSYLSDAGIDLHDSSSSQSSTSKSYEAWSQTDANELNGRFTALQISGEEIKLQTIEQTMSLKDLSGKAGEILTINSDIRNIADDTRNILASTYLETVAIRENTEAIVKPIKSMAADISEVKRNTAGLIA